jgi:hypothetical protein
VTSERERERHSPEYLLKYAIIERDIVRNTDQPPGVLISEENAKNDGRDDDEPAASCNKSNPHHVIVFPEYKRSYQEGFNIISGCLIQKTIKSDCTGIFKQSIGARNRVGIGLSYRPARLHRLAELIPWNRFLGSLKV